MINRKLAKQDKKKKILRVRVSDEMDDLLIKMSKDKCLCVSDLVRTAIVEYLIEGGYIN